MAQPRTETEGCEPALQNDLKAQHAPALGHLDRAITSLDPGWKKMIPADKAAFTQYFDPSGSGEIDDGFVRACGKSTDSFAATCAPCDSIAIRHSDNVRQLFEVVRGRAVDVDVFRQPSRLFRRL